jgi:beta-glucanase (GH16 family)
MSETRAATTQPSGDYQLVWSDDFNADGPLNSNDWRYENGFVRNLELQWYQPDNAICKDGFLVIEARKENRPNPRYRAPTTATSSRANDPQAWRNRASIDYTSASANTRGKHEFLYGRFEIRAKIDVRSGSWPAFWVLGSQGAWPDCGEVDIMEYYDDTVLANIAWVDTSGAQATWNAKRVPLNTFAKNWADQFHTWRMDWDADSIKLYLDDQLINSQDLSKTVNRNPRRGAAANPFHTPMYILLNQAIGGTRGGDPSQTQFPVSYLIDYLSVWQTPEQQAAQARQSP